MNARTVHHSEIILDTAGVSLEGALALPEDAAGLIVFAHGSGSSRFSPRNQFVAEYLNQRGLATLLFDLLTGGEHVIDQQTRALRFDIGLLSGRLIGAIDWLAQYPPTREMHVGVFGASTGSAAALNAAAARPTRVAIVVSRGGRPDLAADALPQVKAPTLLIVGGEDLAVIELNQAAARLIAGEHRLEIVPGATHLFEEPGTLEAVARLACDWFARHFRR